MEAAARGQRPKFLLQTRVHPVLVGEENGLGRALLARVSISVLVAGPGDVVHLFHIGTKDFPIKPSVFNFDLPVKELGETFGHARRTGELSHPRARLGKEGLHHRTFSTDEIEVFPGQAAGVEETDGLFHNHSDLAVAFEHDLL